jgi:glycoside/pentoside/hexuronide:cation symporter, GPH family
VVAMQQTRDDAASRDIVGAFSSADIEPAERRPGTSPAVGLGERLAYGLGDFGSGLYWQTFTLYLAFFYTDVFGLGALAAGTLLGASRSVDALLDPLIGALADRTTTRWGKFRPYLLLGVPLAVVGVLTFTVPDGTAETRRSWAWLTFNALMLLFTAVNIPYSALLAVISPQPAERTALASIKFVFAFAAGLVISAGVLPLCRALGGDDVASGWQRCFAVLGALAALSFLITFRYTRERVQPAARHVTNLRRDLGDLIGNRPWLILTAYGVLSNLAVAVWGSVSVHYVKYYVGSQSTRLPAALPWIGGVRTWQFEELFSLFNAAGSIAGVCGVVALPALARAVGRKAALLGLAGTVVASLLALYAVRPDQLGLLFTLNLVAMGAGSPLSPLLWSMYADSVDHAEHETGRRSTGLVFAAAIFATKQGWALGAILSLGLMSTVGFVANTQQTPESLHGLLLLRSVIPAGIIVLSLIVIAFYPLSEQRVAHIARDLERRRTNEEQS